MKDALFFKTSLGDYLNLAHVTAVVNNLESTGECIVYRSDVETYTFTQAEETTPRDVARLLRILDSMTVLGGMP